MSRRKTRHQYGPLPCEGSGRLVDPWSRRVAICPTCMKKFADVRMVLSATGEAKAVVPVHDAVRRA